MWHLKRALDRYGRGARGYREELEELGKPGGAMKWGNTLRKSPEYWDNTDIERTDVDSVRETLGESGKWRVNRKLIYNTCVRGDQLTVSNIETKPGTKYLAWNAIENFQDAYSHVIFPIVVSDELEDILTKNSFRKTVQSRWEWHKPALAIAP